VKYCVFASGLCRCREQKLINRLYHPLIEYVIRSSIAKFAVVTVIIF